MLPDAPCVVPGVGRACVLTTDGEVLDLIAVIVDSGRPAEPARRQEHPEPVERAALAAVGDVRLVEQRHEQPRRGGEVPDGAARAGQVEVDERDRAPVVLRFLRERIH